MAYHWNRYTKIAATLPLAFLERPYKYLQGEIIFNGLAFIYSISSAVGSSFTHTPPNRCDGQDCPDEERGIHPVG
jgi:hypothetical protein